MTLAKPPVGRHRDRLPRPRPAHSRPTRSRPLRAAPAPPAKPPAGRHRAPLRRPFLRAVTVTAALVALGSALGFGRDLLLARFFGATGSTDAFLVAWTVPETVAPLLIEGAMAFLLIPVFSRAVEQGGDVRQVVSATLPRVLTGLVLAAGMTALEAPLIVEALAPGLTDPGLAVRCTRITAVTVLMFGLAGYLSAALRAHQVFGPPAAVNAAYNVPVILFIVALHEPLGVVGAALGVACGGALMVAVQAPAFLRHVGLPHRGTTGAAVSLAAFVPIAAFTLSRQGQVFVERFVGSSLPPGSISHLNYAQKIAQVPMTLSLIVATVTFPALVRSMSSGDAGAARRRITGDLALTGAITLSGSAFLAVFAPEIVALLLQYGAFTETDTAATALIVRVYSLGLLGHTVVGVLGRVFFCAERPTWYPAAAMAAGLTVTAALAAVTAPRWGTAGITAANAAGITLAAAMLLAGLRRGGPVPFPPARAVLPALARPALAAAAAAGAGWLARPVLAGLPAIVALTLGAAVVGLVFIVVATATGSKEIAKMIGFTPGGERP
ncbi:polysaccharide biosynthesis C-terminal domain-containing protein [Planomonospora sp. ID67723]|uniref:lipid II flippase MurJ n=1 Tax=Planomonospora sp. ID67723 TaxID=2738134 RepID=UPI0018C37DDB|nr:lipid II flippase MurJ [Planomonospora sp. ID67723]MBG0828115.1 polysaccharide biosynthesis C-terminal domain-containing protein [Planomonospora sp. ID67723]